MLHGVGSNGAGWWRLGPELADAGFSVVAPDLRGHGSSPKAESYRLDEFAEDVAGVDSRWHLVLGHSLGGSIALVLAAGDPAWTRLLVLEDPAVFIPDTAAAAVWLLEEFDGPHDAASLEAKYPQWHAEDSRAKAEALASCGPEVVRRAMTDTDPWDLRPLLADLRMATLVLGADPALGAIIDEATVTAAANPQLTYRMVPGGEHSMHRNAYDAFWGELGAFL